MRESSTQPQPCPDPIDLRNHASDNLSFIRRTMEQSASFTAVPGWGTAGMGLIAFAGCLIASFRLGPHWWLSVWIGTAALAFGTGLAALLHKAHRVSAPVWRGPGRRFAMSLIPPLAAGALLTFVLQRAGQTALLPGLWLLHYGVGVFAGGTFSARIIPIMGTSFIVLGVATLLAADALSAPLAGTFTAADLSLAAGFGGLNIAFGVVIARKHGG